MDIEKVIQDRIASTGQSRIEVISKLDLGERSEAAKRVLEKRYRRLELISKGFSFLESCLIVNRV